MDYIYENEFGEKISFSDGSQFRLTNLDGESSVESNISEASALMQIGTTVTGQKVNSRHITLTGDILDEGNNRETILDIVIIGKGKLYFYEGERILYLDVYVSSTPDIKRINQKYFSFSFEVLAPFPYWRDLYGDQIEFVEVTPLFMFPKTFSSSVPFMISEKTIEQIKTLVNLSPVEVGFLATFEVTGIVKNPYISNITTNQIIHLNIEMNDGDLLTIDTRDGSKKVLIRQNGKEKSAFYAIDENTEFFKLKRGENVISFGVDEGRNNVIFTLYFDRVYEGV